MRITVDGTPKEMTTKHECNPERWRPEAQRAKGTNEATKSLNSLLDAIERKVHDARRVLMESDKAITADALKAVLTGRTEKPHMLVEVFTQHNAQVAALVPSQYSPATLTKYTTSLMHTKSFVEATYCVKDVEVKASRLISSLRLSFG